MAVEISKRSSKAKVRRRICRKLARLLVLFGCLSGFLFQTMQFMLLYWTYPTVVDIQKSAPSYLDVPAITICNLIGYNYSALCTEFGGFLCPKLYRNMRFNGKLAQDFTVIQYSKFLKNISRIEYEMHDKLSIKLEDYLNCTIEYLGEERPCNSMDNVMGSFNTENELPNYCYTLYSLWGSPNKKREQIQKDAKMTLKFDLKASGRDAPVTVGNVTGYFPKHHLPTSPSVQIAVHTPYFLPSPCAIGSNYQGGKAYEMRILMGATHLLPSPYQTNCTDYLKSWRENGGKGPVSQTGVVQECRARRYNEQLGCVPIKVDYPHTNTICGTLVSKNVTNPTQECRTLAETHNQPCDSISYTTEQKEVEVTVVTPIDSKFMPYQDEFRKKIKAHDCSEMKVWNPECSRITIDILFDRFEITNLTYNPKFESLELFSAVGGYMGMWLGISLAAMYDFTFTVVGFVKAWLAGRRRQKILPRKLDHSFLGAERKKRLTPVDDIQRKLYDW